MKENFENSSNNLKLSEIFRYRDFKFRKDFRESQFPIINIEYKEGNSFRKRRLLINIRKLFIIKIVDLPSEDTITQEQLYKYTIMNFPLFYNPIVSLNFDLVTAKVLIDQKNLIMIIKVLGYNGDFIIRFNSPDSLKKYTLIINSAIISSEGYRLNTFGVCLRYSNFYRYNFITNAEFLSKANTGDVMIFRGNEYPAPFQRFFTGDEYDHVGMIIKENGVISLYDSTTLRKCSLMTWSRFRQCLFNLVYEKVTYRQLVILTQDEDEKKKIRERINTVTQQYLENTKGKPYDLNVGPIICSNKPRDFEKKNDWEKCPGFNCSSLLTGAFCNMGVMKLVKDCRTFLPGNFSQADPSSLEFKKGFMLGPEEILEFSE